MGQPARECWTEIWHIIGPLIDTPYHGGPATWNDDILLVIDRHGFIEETHFTIAYSPVPDEAAPGGIGGVLATVTEITDQVIQARRVAALRDLGAHSAGAKSAEDACAIAAEALGRHAQDVPFALIYLVGRRDANGAARRRVPRRRRGRRVVRPPSRSTSTPVTPTAGRSPRRCPPAGLRSSTISAAASRACPGGRGRIRRVRRWSLPIPSSIPGRVAALLVVGVSARIQFDDGYRGFFELATAQVATAIANARAYEEERRRAEALAEIDRAKTAFFSNVSHEFRTPLTLMLAPVEDALGGCPAAAGRRSTRERLETAHRNSLRLLKLVNTLLDFSRIEAGRVEARYEPTDLAALTADLASNFRSAMTAPGSRFVVDCPPLAELPSTSIATCGRRSSSISCRTRSSSRSTGRSRSRCDAPATPWSWRSAIPAPASPPEEIPHLFERFHRAKGAPGADARRHGHRAVAGSGARPAARRLGPGRERPRPGKHVHRVDSRRPAHRRTARIAPHPGRRPRSGASPFVEEALRWLPGSDVKEPPTSRGRPKTRTMPSRCPARARILLADDNADMRDYVGPPAARALDGRGRSRRPGRARRRARPPAGPRAGGRHDAGARRLRAAASPASAIRPPPPCRSFCCPRAPARRRASRGCRPAPTTTSSSRSPRGS